jgi:hypothetical protein
MIKRLAFALGLGLCWLAVGVAAVLAVQGASGLTG